MGMIHTNMIRKAENVRNRQPKGPNNKEDTMKAVCAVLSLMLAASLAWADFDRGIRIYDRCEIERMDYQAPNPGIERCPDGVQFDFDFDRDWVGDQNEAYDPSLYNEYYTPQVDPSILQPQHYVPGSPDRDDNSALPNIELVAPKTRNNAGITDPSVCSDYYMPRIDPDILRPARYVPGSPDRDDNSALPNIELVAPKIRNNAGITDPSVCSDYYMPRVDPDILRPQRYVPGSPDRDDNSALPNTEPEAPKRHNEFQIQLESGPVPASVDPGWPPPKQAVAKTAENDHFWPPSARILPPLEFDGSAHPIDWAREIPPLEFDGGQPNPKAEWPRKVAW
jgi:hypothetical protein